MCRLVPRGLRSPRPGSRLRNWFPSSPHATCAPTHTSACVRARAPPSTNGAASPPRARARTLSNAPSLPFLAHSPAGHRVPVAAAAAHCDRRVNRPEEDEGLGGGCERKRERGERVRGGDAPGMRARVFCSQKPRVACLPTLPHAPGLSPPGRTGRPRPPPGGGSGTLVSVEPGRRESRETAELPRERDDLLASSFSFARRFLSRRAPLPPPHPQCPPSTWRPPS